MQLDTTQVEKIKYYTWNLITLSLRSFVFSSEYR